MFKYLLAFCCLLFPCNIYAQNVLSEPIALPLPYSYDTVATKVHPSPTYGLMKYPCSGLQKGDQVEILEDLHNGSLYYVRKDDLSTWIHAYTVQVIPSPRVTTEPIGEDELNFYMNQSDKSSDTPYYLWVDIARQSVYVFEELDGNWSLIRHMCCATGKAITPTARGIFKTADSGEELHSTEYVKYWVKFYKNYLFHSQPLSPSDTVLDTRISLPVSNGCVRLLLEDAQWLYETIPTGTTVWIY